MALVQEKVSIRVIQHELGHLFTLILFAKAGISVRNVKSLRFYLKSNQYEGMVESEGAIDELTIHSSFEDVVQVKEEIIPGIINSMAGNAFETLFDPSKTFEARFERVSPSGMNKDYQHVNNLRTYTAQYLNDETLINSEACIEIAEQYIIFLKTHLLEKLNAIIDYVVKTEIVDVINAAGDTIIFQGETLNQLVELIESSISAEHIKSAQNWYQKLASKHSLEFKEAE